MHLFFAIASIVSAQNGPLSSEPVLGPAREVSVESKEKWYDNLDWLAFVDAYGGYNLNEPSRRQASSSLRAFDVHNGFSLAWVGLNLDFQKEQVGGTAQFRFGPSANTYNSGDVEIGLAFVKQAYVTYRPKFLKGRWSFDFGKFDTPYGAEVADSQDNFNYTRGVLNWLGQPFFHTGVRIQGDLHERFGVTFLAANGWNRSLDNNRGKSFGLQFQVKPISWMNISLGYMFGPENSQRTELVCDAGFVFIPVRGCVRVVRQEQAQLPTQGSVTTKKVGARLRHLADLVITAQPHPQLELVANVDFGYDELVLDPINGDYQRVRWYGAMLGAKYAWSEKWSTALRGEWYEDPDGATVGMLDANGKAIASRIFTATGTLAFQPLSRLLFKIDSRYDHATQPVFAHKASGFRTYQATFSLGAVVKTR